MKDRQPCSYNKTCHLGHAFFRTHDFSVCHGRWLLFDLGTPEIAAMIVSKRSCKGDSEL